MKHGVAGDVVERICCLHVPGGTADDDGKFTFVVILLRYGRCRQRLTMPDLTVTAADEQPWIIGFAATHLFYKTVDIQQLDTMRKKKDNGL